MAYSDLTGSVYSKLTVIEKTDPYITPSGNKAVRWLCRCECGNEVKVTTSALNSGAKKMCSDCTGYGVSLVGKTYGKLTVIEQRTGIAASRGTKIITWLCRCECGNEFVFTTSELNSGKRYACVECTNRKPNLIGKTFNQLTVIDKAEPFINPRGEAIPRWLCVCECGNTVIDGTAQIQKGKRKCCSECSEYSLDLTNQRFGYLVALRIDKYHVSSGGNKYRKWLCLCDCGNETTVITAKLRNGHTRSCGKCGLAAINDLTGQRFDKLLVLEQNGWYVAPNGERAAKWLCLCDCGDTITVRGSALQREGNHSCNCYRKILRVTDDEMIGQIFGRLTVLSRAEARMSTMGSVVSRWNCKCDCGELCVVDGARLRNGLAQSCGGHTGVYMPELRVALFLDSKGVECRQQKQFPGLVGVGGGPLRFDFYVELDGNPYLIECQGLQHYKPIDFFGGVPTFERQVANDAIKVEFSQVNQIPLLCIDCSSQTYPHLEETVANYLNLS